ncbi:hypothetical protein BJI67_12825 [Acidihalobacter aeolianus]|uniref:DUF302 domain-containing protein n=1 Tax=Acidihalobacter aeolianus TaxID=2792603 RepID=A0A1D8KA42_9GAMM|nr:DUF302 domain-containing protein [Acidihalobacter aeolianus]AOV17815.1 hypothetical protein BJI67_12825 [Acidihalobacter aeolianus]
MQRIITACLSISIGLMLAIPSIAQASDNGIVTLRSHHSVPVTLDRLIHALKQKHMTIFARIDHSKGAHGVGLALRPTELLIFGNPKIGTKLMECKQTAGLDLPLKALAWQDAKGRVWLSYNSPEYIARRDHLGHCAAGAVATMHKALHAFAEQAVK